MIFLETAKADACIPYTKFTGGEVHLNVSKVAHELTGTKAVWLTTHIKSSDDFMSLVMCVDAIRQINPDIKIHLGLPYVPYGRQDRVCNYGEAHSLKAFCKLLNSLEFSTVTIADPHSDVTSALIDRVRVQDQTALLAPLLGGSLKQFDALIAPDVGASKKVAKVAAVYGIPYFQASKTRDLKTGQLGNPKIEDIPDQYKRLLVVDDLIDRGGTFLQLGELLTNTYPEKEFSLYATHGIFASGINGLDKFYRNIYCKHLFNIEMTDFVKTV